MTLAEKLKKLRIKNKLSMSEAARLSERAEDPRGRVTQGYISRLESGAATNPSVIKLLTLSDIYKTEPNKILVRSGKRMPKRPL